MAVIIFDDKVILFILGSDDYVKTWYFSYYEMQAI